MKWIVIVQWCHFAQQSNCISLIPPLLISVTSIWPHFRDNLEKMYVHISCLCLNISFRHSISQVPVKNTQFMFVLCFFWAHCGAAVIHQMESAVRSQEQPAVRPSTRHWTPKLGRNRWVFHQCVTVCENEHDEHVGTLHHSLCHQCVRWKMLGLKLSMLG